MINKVKYSIQKWLLAYLLCLILLLIVVLDNNIVSNADFKMEYVPQLAIVVCPIFYMLISTADPKDHPKQQMFFVESVTEIVQSPNAKVLDSSKHGFVYILKAVDGMYYKIGRTRNPDNRLRTFNVKLPFLVEYDLLLETEDMHGLESALHDLFDDKRINGEWFSLTTEDVHWIRSQYG